MAKKKNFYEVTDSHPASWIFGPVILGEKDAQQLRRKSLNKTVRIRSKLERTPPKK
jgi:hypothetical protein